MASVDEQARGFISAAPDALRYNSSVEDPDESTGKVALMIPRGARVLDVGCGTGSISRLLMDWRGVKVIGLEPHPERARLAEERGVEVVGEFLTKEIIPKLGIFDVVLFADVLEHMTDPYEALVLAKELLAPGGSVVVSVPNVAHWSIRIKLLLGVFDYQSTGIMDATHLRWFTLKTLRSMLEGAGYRVVESQASAGLWMSIYKRTPLRWLSRGLLRRIVRMGLRRAPGLFGCQHILRAQIQDSPAG